MVFQEAAKYLRPVGLRVGRALDWGPALASQRTARCCRFLSARRFQGERRVLVFNLRGESVFLSRHWSPNLRPAGTSCTSSPPTEQADPPRGGAARPEMAVTDGQAAPACLWVIRGQCLLLSLPMAASNFRTKAIFFNVVGLCQ